MIEASAAISTLASAIAPPPPVVESQVRAPVADQPSVPTERASSVTSLRYFRFNLKYDANIQQLYVVFRNPVTGDVVEQTRSNQVFRSPATSSRPAAQTTERVVTTSDSSSAGASSAPVSVTKSAAPSAPGPSAAPAAPGASASAEVSRGSAVDSRI